MEAPQYILLKDVLAYMDSGQAFSMAFVTCDKKRHTGGEWINVSHAVKHSFSTKEEEHRQNRLQPKFVHGRRPNHYENSTRNIRLKNGEIRKIHIRLIRVFNNLKVV